MSGHLRTCLLVGCFVLMNAYSRLWGANLPLGQTATGTIASAGQTNAYSFSASANDVLDFAVATVGGNINSQSGLCQPYTNCLSPAISVYNSAGSVIGSAFANNGYGGCGADALGLNLTIPSTGTYSVVVRDCMNENTGNYAIYVQRLDAPTGAAALILDGQTQAGAINSPAQRNSYTFGANAADVVDFTVATVGGNINTQSGLCQPYTNCLSPAISVYNSAGSLIGTAFGNNGYGGCGGDALGLKLTIPSTGTYSVLLGDCMSENTGNYNISAQCFGTCAATPASVIRSGVLSHIAAGGSWTTVITLVNTLGAPVAATVALHNDDGSPLSLPMTVTSQGTTQSLTAASVSATIGPDATLLISTGQLASTVVGWAEVDSSVPVGGFAIFRETPQNGSPSEGTVPLATPSPSTIMLPYDDTNGFVMGVALANLSASAANITATIWDVNGNQVGTQTFTIAGNGHTSFVLPTQAPQSAGIQGIVQFQSSGGIAGLGLRFSPFGTFTSVPPI